MDRREFGKSVALKMGIDAVIVDKVIGAMIEDVIAQVEKGEKAHWPYFGTWAAADRKQRRRYSEFVLVSHEVVTPEHKVLRLSFSLPLRGRGWMNEATRRYIANR